MATDFSTDAGNALKQAFLAWVVAHYNRGPLDSETLPAALQALSACGDCMPNDPCERLLLPHGTSYSDGVAVLLSEQAFCADVLENGGWDDPGPIQLAVYYRHSKLPADVAAALGHAGETLTFASASQGLGGVEDDRSGQAQAWNPG